jgi:hypothetical protein
MKLSMIFLLLFTAINAQANKLKVTKEPANASTEVPGKSYYFLKKDLNKHLSKRMTRVLSNYIKDLLKSKGYKEVKKYSEAYLSVSLVAATAHERVNISSTTTTQKIVNGKIVENKTHENSENGERAWIILTNDILKHGKRPQKLSELKIKSPSKSWINHEDNLLKEIKNNTKSLFPKAPLKNMKMKGPPGCLPVFGYIKDASGKVTGIRKGSAAEKAGIKVDDQLVAIDSHSPQRYVSDDVYENFISVPVKLERNGQVIRLSITPSILCIDKL